jgi:hypothetical protein
MTGRRTINRRTVIDAAVFAAVGMLCIVEGFRLHATADAHGLRQELAPGFYVLLLGAVLLVTGAVYVAANLRAPREAAAAPAGAGRAGLAGILGALAGYALLMSVLGYYLSSAIFFMAVLALFGVRKWWVNTPLGLALAAAFHVVFVEYLDIVFPRGMVF